jgi:hypothetical protein
MSEQTKSTESLPHRPTGLIFLSIAWFLLGIGLLGGSIVRFSEFWATAPTVLTPPAMRYLHIGAIGLAGMVGAYGLLVRRPLGWWLAIVFCYVLFGSFVVISLIHGGVDERVVWMLSKIVGIVLLWVYLNSRRVLKFFDQEKQLPRQFVLFSVTLCAVLLLGVW